MISKKNIKILDCTIRDGGYVNNWYFSKEMVREVYRALSKSGVDFVELGFRSTSKYFNPSKYGLWRFCSEEDLKNVKSNIYGSKIAVMGDFGKVDINDLQDKNDSTIDMFRIAVHRNNVFKAIDMLEKIKSKGYIVSLQCMGYSCYTDQEKNDLIDALKKTDIDYVYVADSYGSMFPFHIEKIFQPFLELGNIKVGYHPHNNIQMAFASTLEALRVGIDIVDTTIYGMGRGAGNLQTEILLSYLQVEGNVKYNVIPVLNCIERFFIELMKETPWGYQLPYMISAIFNSHSNYSKELLRRQQYSIEDIWKALEYVKELNPVGFDSKILDDFIRYGLIGLMRKSGKEEADSYCQVTETGEPINYPTVKYKDRYADREFLVLANGPTLKECRTEINQFIKKYNPVVIGANYLNNLYLPDYHAFNNKMRLVNYINTVNAKSKLILGCNISKEVISDYVNRDYEYLVFKDMLDADFGIQDGVITCNCHSISVLLVGMSVVMGAKRIFIVGMDGFLNKKFVNSTLFYEEKFDVTEYDINLERHKWNEKFLDQVDEYVRKNGGEGIHILTPTSHTRFQKNITNYI